MLDVAPRDRWEANYGDLGFSAAAARSYANMTAVSLDGKFGAPAEYERGHVTLQDFVVSTIDG